MTELLSLALAGAVSGGLYALMAAGLVLTYQTSGVFNVGHGAVAFVTAVVFYILNQPTSSGGMGLSTPVAAVIAVVLFAPLLGLMLDLVLFRRLASTPESTRLVGAIGVLIALPAGFMLLVDFINEVFGQSLPTVSGDAGTSPPGLGPVPPDVYTITRGVTVNSDQVAVLIAAALASVGLWILMRHTRLGLETRAGVDRPALARLRGIDTVRSSRIVWALASMMAGLAGVLIAPLFDLSALTFNMIVFTSFTAAVAARLRSVPLALAGGVALGIVQNLVNGYAPDVLAEISGFRSSVPFILLFVLMFFLPSKGREAGTVAEEAPPADPRDDLAPWRRRLPWGIALTVLVVYGVGFADTYWTSLLNRGLVLGLVFLSFVVVTGLGGMVNLAQAAFVTVSGFTVGWLVNHQWPSTVPVLMINGRLTFWVALIVAVVVTSAVGVLVALPSLRLGGLALALATLALAFVGDRLVFQLQGVRNGSAGWSVRRPRYGPLDLGDDTTLFLVLIVLVVIMAWLVGNLQRSATGRSVLALRSSPVAAATSGIDPVRTKLVLFAVSAGIAGFAGAWFAMVNSPITNTSAPPLLGIVWLAVAVTFGIRRPAGAVVAGLVYVLVPVVLAGVGGRWDAPWDSIPDTARHLIANPELAAMLFGLGAIGLSRQPDGVLADVGHALRERRNHRAAANGADAEVGSAPVAAETLAPDEAPATITDPPRGLGGAAGAGGATAADGAGAALAMFEIRAGYGEVEVLHGIDLVVPSGGVVAVLGANGAGKSTLCSVAAGLVAPTAGSVWFDGREVTAEPTHERARAGLVLAPEARGVFPGLSVDDNLAIRLRTPEQREIARNRFPILGERSGQVAGLLSGGGQQQLALAVALADPPRVFIADEPSLGLSPMATETVFEALAELRDLGTALVLVEEQAAGALRLADTVVLVDLGRVAWVGPASEVDVARLSAAYLGAPV